MTLGGLALAVGILVDDATVTIENINWHLEQGKDVVARHSRRRQADRHAGAGLAAVHLHRVRADVLPRRRCALPVRADGRGGGVRADRLVRAVAHAGADAGQVPAAAACRRACRPTHPIADAMREDPTQHMSGGTVAGAVPARLRASFRKRPRHLSRAAGAGAGSPTRVPARISWAWFVASFLLAPWLGENFFPSVDAGQIKLHVRAQTGTRIEETARLATRSRTRSAASFPPDQLKSVVDNIGLPISGINITYSNSAPIGPADADILISLNGDHAPSDGLRRTVARTPAAANFPGALCVPAGRHRQPDPEFRPAGADRHPGHRLQARREPRLRQRA